METWVSSRCCNSFSLSRPHQYIFFGHLGSPVRAVNNLWASPHLLSAGNLFKSSLWNMWIYYSMDRHGPTISPITNKSPGLISSANFSLATGEVEQPLEHPKDEALNSRPRSIIAWDCWKPKKNIQNQPKFVTPGSESMAQIFGWRHLPSVFCIWRINWHQYAYWWSCSVELFLNQHERSATCD